MTPVQVVLAFLATVAWGACAAWIGYQYGLAKGKLQGAEELAALKAWEAEHPDIVSEIGQHLRHLAVIKVGDQRWTMEFTDPNKKN